MESHDEKRVGTRADISLTILVLLQLGKTKASDTTKKRFSEGEIMQST